MLQPPANTRVNHTAGEPAGSTGKPRGSSRDSGSSQWRICGCVGTARTCSVSKCLGVLLRSSCSCSRETKDCAPEAQPCLCGMPRRQVRLLRGTFCTAPIPVPVWSKKGTTVLEVLMGVPAHADTLCRTCQSWLGHFPNCGYKSGRPLRWHPRNISESAPHSTAPLPPKSQRMNE